ncbi:MAG: hypothetical protein R6W82_08430 [bacterium]
MDRGGMRERGAVRALSREEADRVQHELARDPAARFFRVEGRVRTRPGTGTGSSPVSLRDGDVLVALGGAEPNEGDLVVVRLEGDGCLLGWSRKKGGWCLLLSGPAVPLGSGEEARLAGVVVGVLRKAAPAGRG